MTRHFCPASTARFATAVLCAVALAGALQQTAEAQTLQSVIYRFTVPVVKLVPNPCTSGFVLVNGGLNVSIAAASATTTGFSLNVKFDSSGRGDDAKADGALVNDGTQKAAYIYTSSVGSETTFPERTPAFFSQTVNVTDYLVRSTTTSTGDSFLMNAVFKLTFNNGIPETPVLQRLQVACE